jgi:O-antigen/teichoic acid export membrane protein
MDAAMLGFYSIAYFIFAAMKDMVSKITSSVVFPALSEVARGQPEQLKETYYKFRLPVDAVLILALGFLFATANLIIDVLYDARYATAGTMLQILAVGLFVVRYEVTGQCFIAMGKPKLLAPLMIVHLLVLYGLLPVANHFYGVNAALWVVGAGGIATIPLTIAYKIKYGLFDMKKELLVLPLLPVGYLMGLAVVYCFHYVGWGV